MRSITRDVSIPKPKLIKLTCYLCEMLSHLTGLIIMIKVFSRCAFSLCFYDKLDLIIMTFEEKGISAFSQVKLFIYKMCLHLFL